MAFHSKFRGWVFLPVALFLMVTGLLIVATYMLLDSREFPPLGILVFWGVFLFTWLWLFFGELRTKIIKVEVHETQIIVSNYIGLGAKKAYQFSEFDGFETCLLPTRSATYEYLYLIANGKKIIKLSEYYHSNYAELKSALEKKVRNRGQQEFSLTQEIREIFE